MDYLQISELYHYGIKGQKWGVRRYQNEDGTLTEEGKAHYSTSSSDTKQNNKQKSKQKNSSSKESNNQNKTSSKETDSVNSRTLAGKKIEDLTDKELQAVIVRRNNEKRLRESMNPKKEEPKKPEYDKAFRDASKLANDIAAALPKGNGKVIKKDYSDLSDQELRNRISRLQLEDSYGKLTGDTKYVKSGSEKAREVLQTAGALLAVAGSAAALALTIQEIRKNKKLNLSQSDILDEDENSLEHHGIKGQKWGIRRFQNEDGTLTEEGKKRYHEDAQKLTDMSTTIAELEDLTRQFNLLNARKNNTQVLVSKENKKLWQDAYKLYLDLQKKYANDNISTEIKTLDDGTDYVVSSVYDKELCGVVEYYEPLLYDSNGKKYDEKNRLYNTTKSYNQQLGHSDELMHHGIKGQKWGLRRYQNEDGTLTEAGRLRYGGKTHVSELDDDELEDLNEAIRYQHKKKLAIGIGVAVTAAAAIIGATWIAKKRQESLQQPQTKQVLNKTEVASKSPQYHMHQPDTVKPNVFALPAPKKDFIDVDFKDVTPKSSSAKPNIPDWLKKSGNGSKPLSSLKQAVSNTPKYNPRAVTDTYHKTANRYYRLEKDIHGNPFKISKSDWAKAPKIHINHHDMSDYLTFRALYHAMIFGIGYYASDELYHHGIKGQKWGVRRYQDADGSLTPEGRQRYRIDKGTQDILDNSSKYSSLTSKQRNELSNYGRFSGGKRGFIAGLAGGATLGLGKTVLDLVTSEAVRKSSSTAIANRFTRNIMLGALGGSVVGTLVGSVAGKKSAQAQYADRGKIYVEELLNTPIKRIRSR